MPKKKLTRAERQQRLNERKEANESFEERTSRFAVDVGGAKVITPEQLEKEEKEKNA